MSRRSLIGNYGCNIFWTHSLFWAVHNDLKVRKLLMQSALDRGFFDNALSHNYAYVAIPSLTKKFSIGEGDNTDGPLKDRKDKVSAQISLRIVKNILLYVEWSVCLGSRVFRFLTILSFLSKIVKIHYNLTVLTSRTLHLHVRAVSLPFEIGITMTRTCKIVVWIPV